VKLYTIDESQLSRIKSIARFLLSQEKALSFDTRRDIGKLLDNIAQVCSDIPIPDDDRVPTLMGVGEDVNPIAKLLESMKDPIPFK